MLNEERDTTLITPDLILTNLEVNDRWEAIDQLAAPLLDRGYVAPTYREAVIEREKEFPTALPLSPVAVAIPHCATQHCIHPAIALAILKHPIPWLEMATLDKWLDTQVVMLLSITNPQAQVILLQEIIDFFSQPGSLESVIQCATAHDVAAVLAGRFSDAQKVAQG